MTGKLIKHDFISGARRMGNIYLAALIACGAMLISSFFKSGFLRFITSAAVIVIAFVAVVVTFVSVVFGANKSLFGREGYLTHTLPVRTSSLIFSKWLTSSVWVIISYALLLIATVGVAVYWTVKNQEGAEIYEMVQVFLESLGIVGNKVLGTTYLIQAIIGLFNACIFVMFVLFAITLSNIRPFHRLGTVGIILYLALTIFIIQGATYGLAQLCDVTLIVAESGFTMTVSEKAVTEAVANGASAIGFTGVYFKTIVTVFIYILTVQLTETKINLK